MKKGMFVLLLVSSVCVHAQTLKDALFSGKLKNQPGTVIRKGDDLASKIDTTQKVATNEIGNIMAPVTTVDSSTQTMPVQTDPAAVSATGNNNTAADSAAIAAPATTASPKNNNTVWKTYMDSVAATLKTEALPSKKVKRGDYFVLVTYTIGTDGQVTIGDVSVSPENAYLQQQVKARLDSDAPRLSPVLNSTGAPRKVLKKYSFTLSKA